MKLLRLMQVLEIPCSILENSLEIPKPVAAGLELMLLKVVVMLWRYTHALVCTHTHTGLTITRLLSIFACHRGAVLAGLVVLPTCFSPNLSKACC